MEAKGRWVTINGARVFINDKGDVIMGLGKKENASYVKSAEDASDFNSWAKDNQKELKADGLFEPEKAKKVFYDAKYNKEIEYKELTKADAIGVVEKGLPKNLRHGWFVEANSDYKPKIEQAILNNDELRNAGINLAWHNYKDYTGKDVAFKDFLNKNITVYRGKNTEKFVKSDVFVSYTYDEKVAKSFGDKIQSKTIKPSKTLGSYQTTGESEILIRR